VENVLSIALQLGLSDVVKYIFANIEFVLPRRSCMASAISSKTLETVKIVTGMFGIVSFICE
jgi:hypothetical protein